MGKLGKRILDHSNIPRKFAVVFLLLQPLPFHISVCQVSPAAFQAHGVHTQNNDGLPIEILLSAGNGVLFASFFTLKVKKEIKKIIEGWKRLNHLAEE